MWRRLCLLITVIIILAAGTSAIPARVHAQASVSAQAWTPYAITVYRSPDRSDHIVGVLAPETGVQLEGRTSDTAWVLTHSLDGIVRGFDTASGAEIWRYQTAAGLNAPFAIAGDLLRELGYTLHPQDAAHDLS